MALRRREAFAMVTRVHLLSRSLFRSEHSLPREDGRRATRGPSRSFRHLGQATREASSYR